MFLTDSWTNLITAEIERLPPICVKKWMTEGSMENIIEDDEFSDTDDMQ